MPCDAQAAFEDGQVLKTAESDEVILCELATLSPLEYEQQREDMAKQLKIRVSVLDGEVSKRRPTVASDGNDLGLVDPKPWDSPVNGAGLIQRIIEELQRYIVMPPHIAEVVALWVVHTYAFEFWRHTPRLAIRAADKGSGKSTMLDVLACVVRRAVKADSISTAVLFRVVDQYHPTMLIDEVDSFLCDNEELRGALNAGHSRMGKHFRCEGDQHSIKAFKTFAPVATAGIGELPGTLADRSIDIVLKKKLATEHVDDFNEESPGDLPILGRMAARWVKDNEPALRAIKPVMPTSIHNRKADNWRPFLAIADVVGGEWPARARGLAEALTNGEEDNSITVMLLADIRDIFDNRGASRITSADVAEALEELEDRPWPEWRQGKPISANKIARLLNPFGIKPKNIKFPSGRVLKGYERAELEDAFSRYLSPIEPSHSAHSPDQTATNATAAESLGCSPIQSATEEDEVAVANIQKPAGNSQSSGVAVEKGDAGEEWLY
jgi:hypothetical protein